MCACSRDKVIETYNGVRTLEERGGVNVLVCSCLGERTICVIEIYMVNSVCTHG